MKKKYFSLMLLILALFLLQGCSSKKEYTKLFEEGYAPFASDDNNLTPENVVEIFENLGFAIAKKNLSDEMGDTNIIVVDDSNPEQEAEISVSFGLYEGNTEPQFIAIIYLDKINNKDAAYITEVPETQKDEYSGHFIHSFDESINEKVASVDEQREFLLKKKSK